MVAPILKLSKLQIRTVFTGSLQKPTPAEGERLADEDLHALLVADLLNRLTFLSHEQKLLIVGELRDVFAAPETALTQLAFADGNYCFWTGRTSFLDLSTGDTVQALPMPPVETISYNLTVLYQRARQQVEKRSRHGNKHSAGSLEESGDVRDGTPDAVS